MTEPRHWIRPLTDGRVEFLFAAGGERIEGSGGAKAVDELRERFEQHVGIELPEPEVKPARPASQRERMEERA